MLTIRKEDGGDYVARCGKASCILPIIERVDPESGRTLTETISPSGIRGLFRTAVDVTYTPVNTRGKDGSVSELAQAIGLDVSYAARLHRLTLLAPDIIEAILDGEEPDGLSMRVLAKPIPLDWREQRKELGFPDIGLRKQ